jgi:hypothetical protein
LSRQRAKFRRAGRSDERRPGARQPAGEEGVWGRSWLNAKLGDEGITYSVTLSRNTIQAAGAFARASRRSNRRRRPAATLAHRPRPGNVAEKPERSGRLGC